jgi:hypothetical protein
VVAIDFEDAFRWKAGEDKITLYALREFRENFDPQRVRQVLERIEGLSSAQIEACCAKAGLSKAAIVLDRRRYKLHELLCKEGFLTCTTD